jgi:hypothetical protein
MCVEVELWMFVLRQELKRLMLKMLASGLLRELLQLAQSRPALL